MLAKLKKEKIFINILRLSFLICSVVLFSFLVKSKKPYVSVQASGKFAEILLSKRDVRSWNVWSIDGGIKFFMGLFIAVTGVVLNGCGPGIMEKMGMPGEAYQGDQERNCIAAISALAASGFAGSLLIEYGTSAGWIFTGQSASSPHKRNYMSITEPKVGTEMLEIMPGYHIEMSNDRNNSVYQQLQMHHSIHHENIIMASPVYNGYSNGTLTHVGDLFTFNNTIANTLHSVFTPVGLAEVASTTLQKFDGINQVFSDDTVLVNSDGTFSNSLQKRDSPYAWASFTGWGGNTGYLNDLIMWNEFPKTATAIGSSGNDLIQEIDGCSNSEYCFSVSSKFCYSIGFSATQGDDDAEVGEIYIQSFGGLDYDCVYG